MELTCGNIIRFKKMYEDEACSGIIFDELSLKDIYGEEARENLLLAYFVLTFDGMKKDWVFEDEVIKVIC